MRGVALLFSVVVLLGFDGVTKLGLCVDDEGSNRQHDLQRASEVGSAGVNNLKTSDSINANPENVDLGFSFNIKPREKRDSLCDTTSLSPNLSEKGAYIHFRFKVLGIRLSALAVSNNNNLSQDIQKMYSDAKTDTKNNFPRDDATSDESRAFRQALWMYRVTKKIDYKTAKSYGDGWERTYFHSLPYRLMDLHNNEKGRCLAEENHGSKSDIEIISSALRDNQLQTVVDNTYGVKWPKFSSLLDAYRKEYPLRLNPTELLKVFKLPGWLNTPNLNTCAIRVSRALISTGHRIYFDPYEMLDSKEPSDNWAKVFDGDGHRYIIRVQIMRKYLEKCGKTVHRGTSAKDFKDKQGIIIFEGCNFDTDSTSRHSDLWDGSDCAGSCYFSSCSTIRLFELK